MVDVLLMQSLLRAGPGSAALLIVGESISFPPSARGMPCRLIGRRYRHSAPDRSVPSGSESKIITNAHLISQGRMPDLAKPDGDSDFDFVPETDPEEVSGIVELVRRAFPSASALNPIRDIQVLCPMNRGGVGARSLNIELQAALNPVR